MKKNKLNLRDLEVKSFITQNQFSVQGGAALGGAAHAGAAPGERVDAVLGETLDERPCTFPSMEPEGCR